ncbi:protein TolQ [Pelodictyon luteolum]|uniref:Cell division and transport-associated protein TolQ n=1 Tax=Chlorobium luteolum (strain DSM 273 / BCRC 81028 / 2530) TaxID=319225 RepID=Q3B587_CHLL3|nr:protein TolQ [Pelodictyon luteolum]ABB23494.1 Cell division and transport-associated protein TolQ [Pelodictyon luteolum DSM 273]
MPESHSGILALLSQAGPVVLFVLGILLLFSVVSWAIIFQKFTFVRKSMLESKAFLDSFFQSQGVERIFAESENYRDASLAKVFRAAYIEYRALGENPGAGDARTRIARAVKREGNLEVKRLSQLVPFLATVGNTAPFIGLFGTVWGIMDAFQNIGMVQSASLAAVAPGISEALVATAAGLAAAIPAVMGYNYLSLQVGIIERDIEEFSPEFTAVCIPNQPQD